MEHMELFLVWLSSEVQRCIEIAIGRDYDVWMSGVSSHLTRGKRADNIISHNVDLSFKVIFMHLQVSHRIRLHII